MSMPTWLKTHLVLAGRWNLDGVTRTARGRACKTCRADTFVGLDADRCAGTATTDAAALTPLGEALALAGGRATYRLSIFAGHLTLDHRDQWVIRAHPADQPDRTWDVVAEHRCDAPPLPSTNSHLPVPAAARQETTDAPY